MVFSKDEDTIYVANPRAGTISAIDVRSGKRKQAFKIGAGLHGLDISEGGRLLFASSRTANVFTVLDIATGKQRTIKLSPAPYHLNTIRGTNKVYVSSSKTPKIWVIDWKKMAVVNEIKLPAGEGHQMAIVP